MKYIILQLVGSNGKELDKDSIVFRVEVQEEKDYWTDQPVKRFTVFYTPEAKPTMLSFLRNDDFDTLCVKYPEIVQNLIELIRK